MNEQPQQKPAPYRLGPHPGRPSTEGWPGRGQWALGCPPPRPQLTACDPLLPACWDSSEGGYRVTGGVRTQASVPHDCIQVLRAHTTAPGEGEAARPFRAPELLHPPWPAPTLTPVPAGAGRRQALICHQRDTPSLRGASPTHRDWRGGLPSLLFKSPQPAALTEKKLVLPQRSPGHPPHKVPKQPFSLWPLPPCD